MMEEGAGDEGAGAGGKDEACGGKVEVGGGGEGETGGGAAAFLQACGGAYYPGVRPMEPALRAVPAPARPPAASPSALPPTGAGFTFAEVFAGIGGFRLGLSPLGGECVLAAEIDVPAVETYRMNFGGAAGAAAGGAWGGTGGGGGGGSDDVVVGDISEYYADSLPDFDVLTGGFPCQPFSTRGGQVAPFSQAAFCVSRLA